MAADRSAYAFDVSTFFFRLATECLRLYSNETSAFASLSNLVETRAPSFPDQLERHASETLRGHLETVPSNGPLAIEIEVSAASGAALLKARKRLGEHLAMSASLADALSILLFDYIVERRTAEMMRKVGGDSGSPAAEDPCPETDWLKNVLRLN